MARIYKQDQYNQEMGKFKLLSSTSGVGAIITTKFNNYVLVIGHSKWGFIEIAEILIKQANEDGTEENIPKELSRSGLMEVKDNRFIKFLAAEKNLNELRTLIDLPNIELNDHNNYISWEKRNGMQDHPSPIKRRIASNPNVNQDVGTYLIKAKHFPGWFRNKNGDLKHIAEWKQEWINSRQYIDNFAPPKYYDKKYNQSKYLIQTNLLLICENGHLSDVPWSKFITWAVEHRENDSKCERLFEYNNCCHTPELKWSENKSYSVGFESIFIECKSCKKGTIAVDRKVNLRGIQSLTPHCPGHKPWENEDDVNPKNTTFIPHENCNARDGMRFVLATANNVYYAKVESSLYIPNELLENYPKEVIKALPVLLKSYNKWIQRNESGDKLAFFKTKEQNDDYFIDDLGLNELNLDESRNILREAFCKGERDDITDNKLYYKFQEFNVFANNEKTDPQIAGLIFDSVDVDNAELSSYFRSIKKVTELRITQVQTQFSRVKTSQRIINENGEIEYQPVPQNTYENDEICVLPANQTVGEGVFIEFNEELVNVCIGSMDDEFKNRFISLFDAVIQNDEQGVEIRRKIQDNQYKFFIIHTFSHSLMREFEFSCGYPTASLKERLYISNDNEYQMAGVLIYTTDGAEGSMGGIISQTEPARLNKIIKNAMQRAVNCSSDPLCWESEGQGLYKANLASCFSCSLVSETTCEEMNLGLDRRVLVDPQFGFFKNLL